MEFTPVWISVLSQLVIGLAYLFAPVTISALAWKQKKFPSDGLFWFFGTLLVASGATHFVFLVTSPHQTAWPDGSLSIVTVLGVVSLCALLWRFIVQQREGDAVRSAYAELQYEVNEQADTLAQTQEALQAEAGKLQHTKHSLQQKTTLIQLLQSVAIAAHEASSIEEATQVCLDLVCLHTGWPVGHVYFPTADGQELISSSVWHLSNPEQYAVLKQVTDATSFSPGVGLPGRVLASHSPVWISDVTQDENFPRARQVCEIGVKAAFAFPIQVGGDVAAVLEFFTDEACHSDKEILEVMAYVGTLLGHVVERQQSEMSLKKSEEQFRSCLNMPMMRWPPSIPRASSSA